MFIITFIFNTSFVRFNIFRNSYVTRNDSIVVVDKPEMSLFCLFIYAIETLQLPVGVETNNRDAKCQI